MKEKGILFSAPMVRALLDNRKTQTRRGVKLPDQPCVGKNGEGLVSFVPASDGQHFISQLRVEDSFRRVKTTLNGAIIKCPYPVGTRVYVKETFRLTTKDDCACYESCNCKVGHPVYRASCDDLNATWKPSIFMPKALARIWLEIVAVRVERLQAITTDDACCEGVDLGSPLAEYRNLWESINGPGSWNLNPWVWAYTFRRIEK